MTDSILNDIDTTSGDARIKVFGVGGAGGNAVRNMIEVGLRGVDFICANTDLQALNKNPAPVKVQLGEKATRGLGAGADPNKGREAAMESRDRIREAIGEADMVFITAGMGGGTGTGAAPVVAQVAREMEKLTVGVVTKPFDFEGKKRTDAALAGVEELKQHVDSLIVIPNDRLKIGPRKATFRDMLKLADDVLYHAVKGISDAILCPGMINVDFADVCTTMRDSGLAHMGTGVAKGESRAREAAEQAINSPLLEDAMIDTAQAILYNITASSDLSMDEVKEIGETIKAKTPADCNIIFGVVFDDSMEDELRLTIIATGIEPAVVPPVEEVVAPPVTQARVTAFTPRPEAVAPAPRMPARQQMAVPDEMPMREAPAPRFAQRGGGGWGAEPADDRPAYGRSYARRAAAGQTAASFSEEDMEIPTFLRNLAD